MVDKKGTKNAKATEQDDDREPSEIAFWEEFDKLLKAARMNESNESKDHTSNAHTRVAKDRTKPLYASLKKWKPKVTKTQWIKVVGSGKAAWTRTTTGRWMRSAKR